MISTALLFLAAMSKPRSAAVPVPSTVTPPAPEAEERITNLRRYRLEKGWSQAELSILSGNAMSTTALADRGVRISLKTARKFAAVLGCDPLDLLPKKTNRP